MTFQLTTGDEQFYVIGIYFPPNCSKGVDDLRSAWDACRLGCKSIVLGDLNINFGFPRDEREEVIVDLLDEINLIDTSHRFPLQPPDGQPPEHGGHGVRITEEPGTTRSQTTLWLVQGI